MLRKFRLLMHALQTLPADFWSARRAAAYGSYLHARFPQTMFDAGCVVGDDCRFDEGVHVAPRTVMETCQVGRFTSIGSDSSYVNCRIGSFCSFGPQVLAGLGRHPTDYVSTSAAFYSPNNNGCRISFVDKSLFEESLPIVIGSDVWLGARTIIIDGVTIGHGAIVAAGAVVTKDVQPYTIVGGVPAKVIRKRFADTIIEDLLEIRWWQRDMGWISQHAREFTNVAHFLDQVRAEQEPVQPGEP